MGSQGIKRRKVRRRPPAGHSTDPQRNWQLQNSPFTFEGEIEGLSRFGRGLGSASPRMRLLAKIVAATFLLPFVVWIFNWVNN